MRGPRQWGKKKNRVLSIGGNTVSFYTAHPYAITFEEVGLKFETSPVIFRNISFAIPTGSFHFLTGPSGVGKSSLLKLIYLSQFPSEGAVKIFGHDTTSIDRYDVPLFRHNIGVVFQDFRLINHLTTVENVALPLIVRGEEPKRALERAQELLAWVGLPNHMKAMPPALSGGQKQRAAIARAVITRPPVLLADEPTGNVDDVNAIKLLYLFEELNKNGTTVMVATHNRALAREFPYAELYLDHGRLTLNRNASSPQILKNEVAGS